MNRTFRALLCGTLTLALLTGCGSRVQEELMDTTISVQTTRVESGELNKDACYIGTISAEGTASVVTMVSGTVEEVMVKVGDTISPEDTLCRIDDESARLSLESARATYSNTLASCGGSDLSLLREQLQMAQDTYDATMSLYELGSATQTEVDQARQALNSAQSSLEPAQATLRSSQLGVESAEYQLSLHSVKSPISGVVEAVNVTENNFTPSGTTAFIISNGGNKTVTFYVTDQVRQTLELGQAVTVAYGGNGYDGVITEISGVVDGITGQFKVKASVSGAQSLPDGLSVELTTAAYRAEDAVLVPSDALFFESGEAYVYVARDGAAMRTEVTVGIYTTETSAVTEGLEPGTEVITTWSSGLRDGVAVLVKNETEDTAAVLPAAGGGEADGAAEGR